MIVKMKKVYLVLQESAREQGVASLKEFGLLHLEDCTGESERLKLLQKEQRNISDALRILENFESQAPSTCPESDPGELSGEVLDLSRELDGHREAILKNLAEIETLAPWGEFNPEDVRFLADKGVALTFFELSMAQYRDLLAENAAGKSLQFFEISHNKGIVRCVASGECRIPDNCPVFMLPAKSIGQLTAENTALEERMGAIRARLAELAAAATQLHAALQAATEEISFEEVLHGLKKEEEQLAYLKGYIPVDRAADLKQYAAAHDWGILLDAPTEEDDVPTLVRRKKPIRIIKPVFDLMGTTPGYREVDISFMFLAAFVVFVSMIIGDAGYGIIVLILGIFGLVKSKPGKRLPFQLTVVLSLGIIAWGVLTGTWFGSESLASVGYLRQLVIASFASYPEPGLDTAQIIQLLCFTIGLIHLALARLEMFFRRLPTLKAWADLGWFLMLGGLYILVLDIVLGIDTLSGIYLSPAMLPLIISGFALVLVFANQEGSFWKGILAGLNPINLLLSFLDGVSAFSNIISYVRLFAVGLSTVAVAASFNSMAAGIGFEGIQLLGSVPVLFIGHTLNLIMGVMSIVVHGIRLNMLEYSGQMGLEWSGSPYRPFGARGLDIE